MAKAIGSSRSELVTLGDGAVKQLVGVIIYTI